MNLLLMLGGAVAFVGMLVLIFCVLSFFCFWHRYRWYRALRGGKWAYAYYDVIHSAYWTQLGEDEEQLKAGCVRSTPVYEDYRGVQEKRYPYVDSFAALMKREIDANAHKGDLAIWRPVDEEAYFEWLIEHVDKLRLAVIKDEPHRVREHAADVANCAMKAAHIYGDYKP